MVLVTPRQESFAPWEAPGTTVTRELDGPAADSAAGQTPTLVDGRAARLTAGQAAPTAGQAAGQTAARDEVLALLRDGSGRRPRFDPGLSGGLRAWLEDGASALASARGEGAAPLYLGPRLLWGSSAAAADPSPPAATDPFPIELVTSCLIRALFRQLVTTGRLGDPLADALEALRVDPDRLAMTRWIDEMSGSSRSALAATLVPHVAHLKNLTPRFAAGWLPRTKDRVAIPLAGGRVVLSGVFDLLVGAPVPGKATLCALGLTTGGRWAQARTALHYLALLETLRSGTPPFRVALLHSALGRYGVEDVIEEHLQAIVSHVVLRLSELASAEAGGSEAGDSEAGGSETSGFDV